MAGTEEPIIYLVDRADIIVGIGGDWGRFAVANGSPELARSVVGSSLWGHVAGDEVILLWRALLARARDGHSVSIPYRCDSPGERRFLQMILSARPGDGVKFVSETRRVEPRPYVEFLDESSKASRQGQPIQACSWCRKFFAGEWVEVEDAITRLGLLEAPPVPISHGMCPACERLVRLEL